MLDLKDSIRRYHQEEKPRDGKGGTLTISAMHEIFPGIVAVLDSTHEIDIFVDPEQYCVNDDAGSYYRSFVPSVREAFERYQPMAEKYGMICIVEDRWHPFFARRRATFEAAEEAAVALLSAVNSCEGAS